MFGTGIKRAAASIAIAFVVWLLFAPAAATAIERPKSEAPSGAPVGVVLGEQYDPDLGLYYLRTRYYSTQLGRFWSMDSFEGIKGLPETLHKYMYAKNDPVNYVDPSGNLFMMSLAAGNLMSSGMRTSRAAPMMMVPGHVASRGALKWAWLLGGIGLGAQTLLQDTELGMEIQLALMSNPTGSEHAYENYKCVEFAADAARALRAKGENPKFIKYQSRPNRTVRDFIMAAPGFGFLGGENISWNGHHRGVLSEGRVYDNNVPFGVPLAAWKNGYLVASLPNLVEMTIGQAAVPGVGVGDITIE